MWNIRKTKGSSSGRRRMVTDSNSERDEGNSIIKN